MAAIRIGLADCLESVLLPKLLDQGRREAPHIQVVVLAVQFRTVEEMLLSNEIDFAVTVADDLPRSILRRPLGHRHSASHTLVCLYHPRFTKLARPLTERQYFAQDHVAVSYAGDARGIVEDSTAEMLARLEYVAGEKERHPRNERRPIDDVGSVAEGGYGHLDPSRLPAVAVIDRG